MYMYVYTHMFFSEYLFFPECQVAVMVGKIPTAILVIDFAIY